MAHSTVRPEILLEDDAVIGVAKPAGLPTANAARGAASLFTMLRERLPADAFLGIVSRLDAPVSGAVVLAKTPAAAAGLAGQFRDRTVRKSYRAIVEGRFPAPLHTWLDWHDVIVRRGDDRRSTIVRAGGGLADGGAEDEEEPDGTEAGDRPRPAHVRARVTRRAGEVSLVELEPTTGRRHQLRVQLASRGCPIVGDRLYGARLPFPAGIALHALALDFGHPATGRAMRLEAALPAAWRSRFPALFSGG